MTRITKSRSRTGQKSQGKVTLSLGNRSNPRVVVKVDSLMQPGEQKRAQGQQWEGKKV